MQTNRAMKQKRTSDLWIPPLHLKQQQAFESIANEILYGGATRGGKSHFVRVAYIVWCSHVPNFQCDIFRLNFDDVIGENMEGRFSFPDLLDQWEKDKLVKITQTNVKFWNGSQISLEYCANDRVKEKHQGIARQARAFGEATQIPAERIKWLRSWCTITKEMREMIPECLGDVYPDLSREQLIDFFPKILYLSNPIGASAGYFRKYFVKARPKYAIGFAPEEDGGYPRQYIPARVEDNPSEDAILTHRRVKGVGDKDTADALLNENWDAPIGDFFRDYDDLVHTIPDIRPHEHWFKYMSFDWGSAEPFCVLWWCVTDDTPIECGNMLRTFPRGALICYREWYGADPDYPSKGLHMRNPDIAAGMIERTHEDMSGLVLTDSYPFIDVGGTSGDGKRLRMADTFAACGVPLVKANTKRVFGCTEIKARLKGIGENPGDIPLIYFCESCVAVREYLPAVATDPTNREAYVEDGDATHSVDCVRYACATRPIVKDAPKKREHFVKPTLPTPVMIAKQIERRNKSHHRSY